MDLCLGKSQGPAPAGEPGQNNTLSVATGATEPPVESVEGPGFGDYELLKEVARGGMGVVYKARQKSLNRIVALKMVLGGPLASVSLRERFVAEAQTAAGLQHPNIVVIHEVGEHAGQPFFTMDYVEGRNLAELLREGPLPPRLAATYARSIAEAVQYAHGRGILHRDLKPANVIIDRQDQPRITDFGLAKRLDEHGLCSPHSPLTLSGQVLGSPNFMAPEQAQGRQSEVGPPSDIYSIGALLYHLLTGRPPFQAASLTEVLRQVLTTEPAGPRLLNPSLPRDLETICLKCLEKDIARRYSTAQALADDLGRFLRGEPILARPLGRVGKTVKWCRRNPQLATFATVATLAVLLGLVGLVWEERQSRASELRARQHAYVLAINGAEQALKAHELGRAAMLLEQQRPATKAETDLRGFEWRYLWQQCQSDAETEIGKVSGPVRSLEVSPDGRWLAAGSELGAVKLWDLSTGEELVLLSPPRVRTYAAFSRDSRLLLFGDGVYGLPPPLGKIAVWDLAARKYLEPIRDFRGIGPLAFTQDGRRFAYGVALRWLEPRAAGRGLVVLDFPGRKKVAEVVAETDQMDGFHGYECALTPDGEGVVYSEIGSRNELVSQAFAPGGRTQRVSIPGEPISAMALSPDGRTLATSSGPTETLIRLWEVPGFRSLGELTGHSRWVIGLRFSPDGRNLASASADQTIRIWDVATRSPISVPRRLRDEAWRVCFSPDGRKVFGGSKDGSVYRWSTNAPQEEPKVRIRRTDLPFRTIAMAPDGKRFSGIRQGMVYMVQAQSSSPPVCIGELGTNNLCVLFSANSEFLFAGAYGGEVQVWSLEQRRLLNRLRGSEHPVRHLQQDAGGSMLAVLQWGDPVPAPLTAEAKAAVAQMAEGHKQWFLGFQTELPASVTIWHVRNWRELKSWSIPGEVSACTLSPDGRFLATSHAQGSVYLWDLDHRYRSNTVACPAAVSALSFSPNGRWLAASIFWAGSVRVWEMPGLKWHVDLSLPDLAADLSFSRDSRRLATANAGANGLCLWDLATWQPLITLDWQHETQLHPTFTSDGNQLSSVNGKGEVLFWTTPSFAEIEKRESRTWQPGSKPGL